VKFEQLLKNSKAARMSDGGEFNTAGLACCLAGVNIDSEAVIIRP